MAVKIKGLHLPLNVIQIEDSDFDLIKKKLESFYKNFNKLLNGNPVIIRFKLKDEVISAVLISKIIDYIRSLSMYPIGLESTSELVKSYCENSSLAFIDIARQKSLDIKDDNSQQEQISAAKPAMFIKHDVKNNIYAEKQDLIILGDVEKGAEIKADGNIIIYGSLNGIARAGLSCDNEAHIFANSINTNFVAINEFYGGDLALEACLISDNTVFISLENQDLVIKEI